MQSFSDGYGAHLQIESSTVNGLPVLISPKSRSAVVIGHPLWHHEEQHWNPEMREAVEELHGLGFTHIAAEDTYVLDRTPIKLFNQLLAEA